jgi:hypothetical protein
MTRIFDNHRMGETLNASDSWYGAMTGQVNGFFGRLRRVSADAWVDSACADPHTAMRSADLVAHLADEPLGFDPEYVADQLARARLRDIMDTMPSVVRRIRMRIERDLTILDGIVAPAALARMRRAARLAACALAAEHMLSHEEFERLYRPFLGLIPPADLTVS